MYCPFCLFSLYLYNYLYFWVLIFYIFFVGFVDFEYFFGWWCGKGRHLENHHFFGFFLVLLPALLGQVGEILPWMSKEALVPGARPSQFALVAVPTPGNKCLIFLCLPNCVSLVILWPPSLHYFPLIGGSLPLVTHLPLLWRTLMIEPAPELAVEFTMVAIPARGWIVLLIIIHIGHIFG